MTRRKDGLKFECTSDTSLSQSTSQSLVREKDVTLGVTVSATPTTSERKIGNVYDVIYEGLLSDSSPKKDVSDSKSEVELDVSCETGHRIIDIGILNASISSQLSCKFCGGDVKFIEIERRGLGSKFAFLCSNKKCDAQNQFTSSETDSAGGMVVHSINRRAVFAMRCIGGDRSELLTFCGVMNLPPPVLKSSYNIISKNLELEAAATEVQDLSMANAAQLEYDMAEKIDDTDMRNIDGSADGTWMTRGHTSTIEAASIIGCATGKVLDTGIKSKVCKSCEVWHKRDHNTASYHRWEATHAPHCTLSHVGSSGSMEAAIITDIFECSVDKYNLRYSRFIGDGDTNTYKKLSEAKPYGDDVIVEKLECVGHVQKRLGTRLRNLKRTSKGQKLKDGKSLEGKGRLTDKQIDKMQCQYGSAIRSGKGDLVRMRENVWAVWFHKVSTDDKPTHHFCTPKCPYKYKIAEAEGRLQDFKHKSNLPIAVMDAIKPIFKDLSQTQLLRKCLEGFTQNPNESFNGVVWNLCPKVKNHGLTTVKTAVAVAVGMFNDGGRTYAAVLEHLGLSAGVFTEQFITTVDAARVTNAQKKAQLSSHEARIARRRAALVRNEQQTRQEGDPYQPGGY